jgi:hypothetical protein
MEALRDLDAEDAAIFIAEMCDAQWDQELASNITAQHSGAVVDLTIDPDNGPTKRFYFRVYEGSPLEPITDGH